MSFPIPFAYWAQSGSCPPYTPGLYTKEEIDDLVDNQGYIPVASAAEFDLIDSGSSETMGAGSCWEGTYTTGLNEKYLFVNNIDFTSVPSNYSKKTSD
jgi:hypothetical protein